MEHFIFFHIGSSSSQLTNSNFFRRGRRAQAPTRESRSNMSRSLGRSTHVNQSYRSWSMRNTFVWREQHPNPMATMANEQVQRVVFLTQVNRFAKVLYMERCINIDDIYNALWRCWYIFVIWFLMHMCYVYVIRSYMITAIV